jgi:cell division protease FtsH
MVTRYGFSDLLGPVLYGQENGEVFLGREITHNNNHSPEIANRIDSEIKRIVEEGYNKAISILTEHKDKLELIASKLIENEKLDENEFSSLMQG